TVIALHNNTDGGYSLLSYLPGGSEAAAGADVHRSGADTDNFFLVTQERLFRSLKARNFNVALQDNRNAPEDGSLSVYCGKKGISYINVEAQHGDSAAQTQMLKALFEILGAR
ncbi:MAG: M15 family peptidase, partial [Verrucomicrobiota bacterium]